MTDRNEHVDLREDIENRRYEVSAAEIAGRIEPPDLVDKILGRLQEPVVDEEPSRGRWLWAAAVILLGLSVTWTIAKLVDSALPDPVVPVQDRPIPDHRDVTSRKEVESLPIDTVHVRGHLLIDDDLDALTRLRSLRFLDLSRCQLTDACLATLARLPKIERLLLNGLDVRGHGFARLAALPNLVHLELRGTKVDAKGMAEIAKLGSLRHLDVAKCRMFTDAAMQHVLRMKGLRHLVLNGNALIGEGTLLKLGELNQLRHLELADIDGTMEYQPAGGLFRGAASRTGDGRGIDDRVIGVLIEKVPGLRFLNLAGCTSVSPASARELLKLRHLHSLDVTRCPLLAKPTGLVLAERPGWRLLGIPESSSKAIGRLAKNSPRLQELRLSGQPTTRPQLQALPKLPNLQVLQLTGMTLRSEDLLIVEDCPKLGFIRVTGCSLTTRHDFAGLVGRATFLDIEDGDEVIQFNKHKRR